jgi:hypothetical protein
MKGGANIVDQQVIRRAVEAGCADASALSHELLVPVDCVQSFIDHYEKLKAPIDSSVVASASEKTATKKRRSVLDE